MALSGGRRRGNRAQPPSGPAASPPCPPGGSLRGTPGPRAAPGQLTERGHGRAVTRAAQRPRTSSGCARQPPGWLYAGAVWRGLAADRYVEVPRVTEAGEGAIRYHADLAEDSR